MPHRPDVWPRLIGLARFSRRARRLLQHRITAREAQTVIREGLARRSERFLAKLDAAVYANASSPYRKLLASAGCERGDVAGLVEAEGLEGALSALAARGVFLRYDEFKCQRPVARGSQTFHFSPDDFNDPSLASHF